jgi:transcriptional regulator with XRE-family HTH domain
MDTHPPRGSAKLTRKQRTHLLRKEAGRWLRELREKCGLSQRELADKVGVEFHTLIAQLEHGRGRIPPDRYLVWAAALEIEPRELIRRLTYYYDPDTYKIVFQDHARPKRLRPPFE